MMESIAMGFPSLTNAELYRQIGILGLGTPLWLSNI